MPTRTSLRSRLRPPLRGAAGAFDSSFSAAFSGASSAMRGAPYFFGGAAAGAGVGVGPLPAHGQALAMADAAVAADVHEALDAHGHFAPQVAFDLVLALDDIAHSRRLLIAPGLDPFAGVDPGVGEDLLGGRNTDPVDVLDRDLAALVPRQVHSGDTCH